MQTICLYNDARILFTLTKVGYSLKMAILLAAVTFLIMASFSSINYNSAGISISDNSQTAVSPNSATTFYGNNPSVGVTPIGTLSTQEGPNAIAFDSQNNLVFIADYTSGDVSIISGDSVVGMLSFGSGYETNGLTFDAYNGNIYASLDGSQSAVGVITPDASTPSESTFSLITFSSYTAPGGIVALPSGAVYVSLSATNQIAEISGNTLTQYINVASNPQWISYDAADAYLYVISDGTNSATITVINPDGNSVVNSFSAPIGAMIYSSYTSTVYDINNSEVLEVTGTSPMTPESLSTPGSIWVATPGTNDFVFAANQKLNLVDIYNESHGLLLAGTVATGNSPQGILYVPNTGYLYVSNFQSSDVSVYQVTPCYPVSFQELNLPLPTTWSVTVATTTYTSSSSSLNVQLPTGTYSYTYLSPVNTQSGPYVTTTNPTGTFDVTGSNYPAISVTYTQEEFTLTFQESGLPASDEWSVNFNGNTHSSTTDTLSVTAIEGTYSYSIVGPSEYSPLPSSGSINLDGNTNIPVSFSYTGLPTYTLTFNQASLPSGSIWYVDINGVNQSATQESLIFTLDGGDYSYSIYSPGYLAKPPSGTVDLTGDLSIFISFSSENSNEIPLTFTESGLPSGTEWYVQIPGEDNISSTASSLSFNLPSGNYDYTVYAAGFSADPSSGSVDLTSSFTVDIEFSYNTVKYEVYFDESGLPQGTDWFVNIIGIGNNSVTSPTYSVSLPAGTYSFTVYADSFSANPAEGQITVPSETPITNVIFSKVSGPFNVYHDFLYQGQEYNFSMDINGSIFTDLPDSGLQALSTYIGDFLTFPDIAYIKDVKVTPLGSGIPVSMNIAENITYDLMVWSQINSTELLDNFGPDSLSQNNLATLQNGVWSQEVGAVLPDVINALTLVGDLGDILSSTSASIVKQVADITGMIEAAFNSYSYAQKEYGAAAADLMYKTMLGYGLVSSKYYNNLEVLANLSNLGASHYSSLISSLYSDSGQSITPSSQALGDVVNAITDATQYAVKNSAGDLSVSDLSSSLSEQMNNLYTSVADGTSDGATFQATSNMFDQSYSDFAASTEADISSSVSDGVGDAADASSTWFGPQMLLAIASEINQLYIAPQGQLLSQETGIQSVLSNLYGSMDTLIPSMSGSVPDLSEYSSAAYLAGMIRSAWGQWFVTNTELNDWNINSVFTPSYWNSIVDNFISQQYNASYFLQYLQLMAEYANGMAISGISNNHFFQMIPYNLLDGYYISADISPSTLVTFANDVTSSLNAGWNAVYDFGQSMEQNLSKLGGYVLNGVEAFSQNAYSEISSLSQSVLEYLGSSYNDLGVAWSYVSSGINHIINFFGPVYSSDVDNVDQNYSVIVSSGRQLYIYDRYDFFASNEWASGMVSNTEVSMFTGIPGSSNFSISSGFQSSATMFIVTDQNGSRAQRLVNTEPDINYTFSGENNNGNFTITPVQFALDFYMKNYYGEHWYVVINNGSKSFEITSNGPYANATVLSGFYTYSVFVNGSTNAISSGQVRVSSQPLSVTVSGPSDNIWELYVFLSITILIAGFAVILIRKRRR